MKKARSSTTKKARTTFQYYKKIVLVSSPISTIVHSLSAYSSLVFSSASIKLPVHESIPISNALEILVLKSTTCISHHLKQLVQTCYLHTMCKCMYLTFRTYIITVIHGELNKVFFQALNFNHSIMNTRVMSPVLQTCAYSCVMCNIEEIIVCNLLWQTLHRFNYYFTRIGSHCMQSLCMVFSRIMRIKGPFYEMCHEYILMSTYPSM